MTDPTPPPRFRRPSPTDVPDPATISEQAVFDTLSTASQDNITASAERWRTGLAGLTAIITGGLLIQGPTNAADLDPLWRAILTGLFGLGIAASLRGFWLALRASAGVPTTLRFDDLRREFGTVALYRLHKARNAERDLGRARTAAAASAVLLAAAVLTWWWAPAGEPEGPTVVVDHSGQQSCGTVVDSDATGLRLALGDNPTRAIIAWTTITQIKPTDSCQPVAKK